MTKRERDAFIRNRRPLKQQRLDKSEEVQDWIERRVARLKKESEKCDVCKKRVDKVYDPEVLGVKGFRIWVFACKDCLDGHKKAQALRRMKKNEISDI